MLVRFVSILISFHMAMAYDVKVGLYIPYALVKADLEDPKIANVIVKIMTHYDLIAIHGNMIMSVLDTLFGQVQKQIPAYKIVIAHDIPRPGHFVPETVLFIYRSDVVQVSPITEDKLSGIAYSTVTVNSKPKPYKFTVGDIAIAVKHIFPQLTALPSAYDRIATASGLKDMVLLGNFWTGEPYVSKKQCDNLPVSKDKRFTWYMNYTVNDVALPDFNDAFERILCAGAIRDHVVAQSEEIYNFNYLFNLTLIESARVGPFYPIGFTLRF